MTLVAFPLAMQDRMKQVLRRAGPREIGGILMGQQLAAGHFSIIDFSVDEISGDRAHFVRDVEHHHQALEQFFDRTGHDYRTFNYLGEWHSHPNFPSRPSVTDLCSMQELVDGEREIEFAILLIVKLRFLFGLKASASLHRRGLMPETVKLAAD